MSRAAEQLMTSDQVAELLQIPKRSLDQWAYLGTGPRFVRVGRHRRYRPSAIDAWLQERTVATQHP